VSIGDAMVMATDMSHSALSFSWWTNVSDTVTAPRRHFAWEFP
jgi:hypothetical protein